MVNNGNAAEIPFVARMVENAISEQNKAALKKLYAVKHDAAHIPMV